MAKQVWKFVLTPGRDVLMPEGATPLHVAEQHGELTLWALCTVGAPLRSRRFVVVGTGHELPERIGRYVGTALMTDGALVLHVFEGQMTMPDASPAVIADGAIVWVRGVQGRVAWRATWIGKTVTHWWVDLAGERQLISAKDIRLSPEEPQRPEQESKNAE